MSPRPAGTLGFERATAPSSSGLGSRRPMARRGRDAEADHKRAAVSQGRVRIIPGEARRDKLVRVEGTESGTLRAGLAS